MRWTAWGAGIVFWVGLVAGCDGTPPEPSAEPGESPGPSAAPGGAGMQTVWLVLRQQADLAPARAMRDWRARGQLVFERLTRTASQAQGPLRALLRSRGIAHQPHWIVNAVRITADPDLVGVLRQLPEVASVHPDRTMSLPPRLDGSEETRSRSAQWGLDNIGAPAVWEQFGFRGENVVVASIDTGVDFEHPALRRQYRGRQLDGNLDHNYSWFDPASVCGSPSLAPCDNAGHGTHTMGIIVGEADDELEPNRIGVAPRARWIAAKGCESGDCSLSSLMRAGEWMLAPTDLAGENPRPDLRPHVVNNSWSAGAGDDIFFQTIVKAWVAAGIFPTFASGNDGPGCNSADSPADYSESYAVGAHDSGNQIASFSSRGNTNLGGVKPNVSAPGVNIRSSIPGGGYGISNGTSMATPHVSGAVALIWSAAPGLLGDVAATRALLDQTAVDTADVTCGGSPENNNVFGEGRLDAFAAVSRAPRPASGTLQGTVRVNAGGQTGTVAGARIRAQGLADRTIVAEAGGGYGVVLPAGRYLVTASAFGYVSQTVTNIFVGAEERTVLEFVLEPAPTHVVRGVVRQTDGRALSGARVALDGTPLLAALTDEHGAYAIPAVPPGSYRVSATRGGCFTQTSRVLAVAGDAQVDLDLPRRSDYYGYFCEPRRAGFIDARTVLPLAGDQDSVTVSLPFGFSFYGRVYRQAEVARAGYLSFAPAAARVQDTRPGVERIPGHGPPNGAIYAFWDDLVVGQGSVRTDVVGTSPQRAFVVEWRDVTFRDATNLRVRFEIVLHEDGRIVTQYLDAGPDARQRGASATVGLEDPEGIDGLEYSSQSPSLESGAALLFGLPPSGVLEGQVIDANNGRPLQGVYLLAWNEATGVRATYTDADGRYRLEMQVGLQSVGIYAPSYDEETRAVQVDEGEARRLDLSLRSGRATIAPRSLGFSDGYSRFTVFSLGNTGSRDLSFEVSAGPAQGGDGDGDGGDPSREIDWLTVSPPSGTVAVGGQQAIEVILDRTALPPGRHRANLLIWTDTPGGHSLAVPVEVVILPRQPLQARQVPPASLDDLRAPSSAQQKRGLEPAFRPRSEASPVTSSDGP